MPYAHKIQWYDTTYTNLRTSLRDTERTLDALQTRLPELQQRCRTITALCAKVREILPGATDGDIITEDYLSSFAYSVNSQAKAHERLAENALDTTQTEINTAIERITALRERLRRYPENYTGQISVTKTDITKAFKGLPNLKPKTITTGTHATSGLAFISWVFTGLYLQPDTNPYDWLQGAAPNSIPSLPLQDMRVTITPASGEVTIAALRGQADQAPFIWGHQRTPHPHVLRNNSPCLGDFTGPLREAIYDQDWVSMYTYIRLFLQRAIENDVAGHTWANPFKAFWNTLGFAYTTAEVNDLRPDGKKWTHFIVETHPGSYEWQATPPLHSDEAPHKTPLCLKDGQYRVAAT